MGETPPILLLVFRRPEMTRRMFETVRRARPLKLYVAADGPRTDRPGEAALCEETRRVATNVDWPCSVQTLFRTGNLGCRVGVSTALDWFFDREEEGIILEDDCVPSPSFFPYCAELLDLFRDDRRVMSISGDNFQMGRNVTPYSYYFSRYMNCWGWATWRRAWQLYDRDMTLWPEFRDSGGLTAWSDGDDYFVRYWREIFDAAAGGKFDSWAYRFLFTCWAFHGLTCLPAKNLVSNIGHDQDGTHTIDPNHERAGLQAHDLTFPLHHPGLMVRNPEADKFEQAVSYGAEQIPPPPRLVRRAVKMLLPKPCIEAIREIRRIRQL
jgi:hypothetical protein